MSAACPLFPKSVCPILSKPHFFFCPADIKDWRGDSPGCSVGMLLVDKEPSMLCKNSAKR